MKKTGQDDVPFDVKNFPGQTPQKVEYPGKNWADGHFTYCCSLSLHHSEFLIRIRPMNLSQRQFEHAGLTCYTLLSLSGSFLLFHFFTGPLLFLVTLMTLKMLVQILMSNNSLMMQIFC